MSQESHYDGVLKNPVTGHENCYSHLLLLLLLFCSRKQERNPTYKKRLVGFVPNVSALYWGPTKTNSLTMVRAVRDDLNRSMRRQAVPGLRHV